MNFLSKAFEITNETKIKIRCKISNWLNRKWVLFIAPLSSYGFPWFIYDIACNAHIFILYAQLHIRIQIQMFRKQNKTNCNVIFYETLIKSALGYLFVLTTLFV